MNKIFIFLLVSGSVLLHAQNREVLELRRISKMYDSILIQYQSKARDSLSNLSKNERNRIMATHEKTVNDKRRKLEFDLLQRIKLREAEENKNPVVKENIECKSKGNPFQMPNLKRESTYKPTKSKDVKVQNEISGEASSIVTFTISADGSVKNVRANGSNPGFNRELELTFYKMNKRWTPLCVEGLTISQNFRMPVTMKFK